MATKGKRHRQSLVIIGNGMAAGRLLDELLARGDPSWDITVIGDEAQGSYNRVLLSSMLAGEASMVELVQKPPQWYAAHGLRFINARALAVDAAHRRVSCGGNVDVLYDHLVIATGSRTAAIGAANQTLQGIFPFRGIADAEAITARAESVRQAVVVGGGLLGLEAAWALARKAIAVTVVHRGDWLMNRQLDRTAGRLLLEVLADNGVRVQLNRTVRSFTGGAAGRLKGVELCNGDQLKAGMAVIATGITPNAELGLRAGLKGRKAIEVDAFLHTSDPSISAVGECVEYDGTTFGLVEPIWAQCRTLAARLAGDAAAPFRLPVPSTRLKVSGVQLFSVGEPEDSEGVRAIELLDRRRRIYRRLLLRGDHLCGAVLFGDVRGGLDYLRMMEEARPCGGELPRLLLCGEALPPAQRAG